MSPAKKRRTRSSPVPKQTKQSGDPPSPKSRILRNTQASRVQAHVSSRGRQKQARRDTR